ncbi:MAG: Peptidyl-prolyl cis-trans isomerase PpiD [Myxococcaceae bacterium]|nr:Peptidyl-prolyl cis-trans isomerase PpiD [Myxococcaceae bacterium]
MRLSIFLILSVLCAGACAAPVRKQPRQRLPSAVADADAGVAAADLADAAVAPASGGLKQELVEVRVLVVSWEGAENARGTVTRTKAQALERAQMLARMAKSGDRLAELVRKYSDRPGATEDLGLFRLRTAAPGAFGKVVGQAALALQPGNISEPVETPQGYFVIERRTDPPTGPTRVSARHILISYVGAEHAVAGVKRTEAEARTLADEIDKQAKAPGADWAALAQHTDEPGSKATGGDLGSFARGQMVPAFERVAFALPVGGVSDVVQTPFGFHIITRYE